LAGVLTIAEDKIRTEEITGKNVSSGQSNVNEEHDNIEDNTSHSVDSTENIQSPGGRAGTSHRSYSRGESRGH
jgi:hypothetical protein